MDQGTISSSPASIVDDDDDGNTAMHGRIVNNTSQTLKRYHIAAEECNESKRLRSKCSE